MERLTARNNFVLDNAINAYEHTADSALDRCTLDFLKELREYRKSEEQGLLLRLPCKVGDTVYAIPVRGKKEISIGKIKDVEYRGLKYPEGQRFFINASAIAYTESDIGKYLFFTKEEAEQALAERKNDE